MCALLHFKGFSRKEARAISHNMNKQANQFFEAFSNAMKNSDNNESEFPDEIDADAFGDIE